MGMDERLRGGVAAALLLALATAAPAAPDLPAVPTTITELMNGISLKV